MHFPQTVFENVSETDENGERNAAPLEGIDELLEIDAAGRFFGGVNEEMPVIADREITFTPTSDIVKLRCVGSSPPIGRLAHLGGNSDFGVQREYSLGAAARRKRSKREGSTKLN